MARLEGLPFRGVFVRRGVLRVQGDHLDRMLRGIAYLSGWYPVDRVRSGPWTNRHHGYLPFL